MKGRGGEESEEERREEKKREVREKDRGKEEGTNLQLTYLGLWYLSWMPAN